MTEAIYCFDTATVRFAIYPEGTEGDRVVAEISEDPLLQRGEVLAMRKLGPTPNVEEAFGPLARWLRNVIWKHRQHAPVEATYKNYV